MTTLITNMSERDINAVGADPDAVIDIIDVTTLVSDSAAITQITVKIQNDLVQVTGTSRRNPGDKHNGKIGEMLATARAYKALARNIERRATGLVEHVAQMREQRPDQLIKSQQWRQNVLAVASNDDRIQRAAIRHARESEGSWQPRPMTTGQAVAAGEHVHTNGRADCC